jgi:hypothetical protein
VENEQPSTGPGEQIEEVGKEASRIAKFLENSPVA